MVELCLERSGISKEETLVVGDRLYTDIACGIAAGGGDMCGVYRGSGPEGHCAHALFSGLLRRKCGELLDKCIDVYTIV